MKTLFPLGKRGLGGLLLLTLSLGLFAQSNQYVNKLTVKDKITWMNGSRVGNSLTNAQVGLINFLVYDTADVSAVSADDGPDTLVTKKNNSLKYVTKASLLGSISGHAISLNPSSNYAVNINTGTSTGAATIGGGSGTVAINSSDWDISTTGAITGAGAITSDGLITGTAGATLSGAAISLNASSNFATNVGTGTTTAAVSLGGGSNTVAVNSSAWDITTAGVASGLFNVVVTNTDASETLTAAQTGVTVVATAAGGATTITLPDPGAGTVGVKYYIVQTANQNLIVTATTANGNSIVCDGVATSDNVTISTAGHLIGAGMIVFGLSETQWYVGGLNPEAVLTPEAAD